MIQIRERIERLERIANLEFNPGWHALRAEALERLDAKERSLAKGLFVTRKEVDPGEIEYARGFRQGIMYLLDGIPNTAKPEIQRLLAKQSQELADE